MESVKLGGDDRVLNEKLKWDDLEGVLVGGFENDWTSGAGLLDLEPAGGADAPAVARLEAGEAELGHGSDEVVAEGARGLQEGLIDDAADGVDAEVFGAGVAAAVAVEAGHGGAAAGLQREAEDVFLAVLVGLGRHGLIVERIEALPLFGGV